VAVVLVREQIEVQTYPVVVVVVRAHLLIEAGFLRPL